MKTTMQNIWGLFQEHVLFLLIFMLFLPNYLMYPMLIIMGVYLVYEALKHRKVKFSFAYLLIAYLIVVAFLNKNALGVVAALFVIYIALYVLAIKRRMTPRNYMRMQYYIVWSSLFNFFFVFIKYRPDWFNSILQSIMSALDLGHLPAWQLPLYGEGYFRAYSTFDNPNFYAFILMIVLLVCFNQIQFQLTFRNYRLLSFYAGAFIINSYALFLTGTRAIWLGVALGLFVIILLQRKWQQLKFLVLIGAILGIVVLNHPTLFPRFMEIADHTSIRFSIWESAVRQITKEPYFGKGLFTYALLFDNTHAHNVFIESLLSLGVVGTTILVLFVFERFYDIYKYGHYLDYPLALAVTAAFLIYGIFDMPIYYFQTSLLFVSIYCLPYRNRDV